MIKYLFFFLFFSFNTSAQLRMGYLEIRGRIMDAQGNPVHNANVLFVEHGKGTVSWTDGQFTANLPRKQFSIVVRHLGFESYYDNIDLNDRRISADGLLTLEVVLIEKVRVLRPVSIFGDKISKKPERLLDEAQHFVIDFNFYDDFLILLVRKGSKKVLQKRHLYLDTILFESEVSTSFDSLYKDCMGNLHLISTWKAMQFFPMLDRFYFYKEYKKELFNKVVRNCIQNYNTNYVFVRRSKYNQVTFYYSILTDSMIRRPLKVVLDEMAEDMADFYSNGGKAGIIMLFGGGAAEFFAAESFLKLILTKPIFGPLLRINDKFIVLDPIKDSIFHFDERSMPLGAYSMRFHEQKHWSKWIETDVDHQKVYTRFDIRGQYYFSEVNPYSGELINRYELFENYYPEHLKIKDGAAYYIKMVDKRRVLYRQPLEVNVTGTVEN